jgi:BirA family transcriptional regulator, biotin operon repressor / biotin---[acetyl-CoA-carboxylase] ligase
MILEDAGSTNDVLAELAATGDEPHLSTVLTLNQTGGRGRLGRIWIAPNGKTLAASVLVKPVLPGGQPLDPSQFGWIPLLAGAAMCATIDSLVGAGRTRLKWPNDVQIDGLKVCGVLAELLPNGNAVVLGTGVNLTLTHEDLPVSTATSLALSGVVARADGLVDLVLSGYLVKLEELLARFLSAGADAVASGIHGEVTRWCSTLSKEVRVSLPGGADLYGVAIALDPSGRLLVRSESDSSVQAVAAGDVTHLRYE